MADGDSVFLRGLADFEGETVAVFLAGLDCGDFEVLGARVEIPFGSAGGLLTERYLTQVSALHAAGREWGVNSVSLEDGRWVVPAVIGYRYKSRGQLLRPAAGEVAGSANGPAFGKARRNHQYALLLQGVSKTFRVGTNFIDEQMHAIPARTPGEVEYSLTELFSGVIVDAIHSESDYDGMIAWEATGPYSAQVSAVGGFIRTEDK